MALFTFPKSTFLILGVSSRRKAERRAQQHAVEVARIVGVGQQIEFHEAPGTVELVPHIAQVLFAQSGWLSSEPPRPGVCPSRFAACLS